MLMNTHKVLAKNFVNNVDEEKRFLIKESHFIWGNIKPDCASKYKLHKHYLDESLPMVITKIKFLASLSVDDIYKKYTLNRFNQELGVVCHFLCDYFCVPHNQRWEFKRANDMKDHIVYERNLAKVAKNFVIKKDVNLNFTSEEVVHHIMDLQKEYQKKVGYENDLKFTYYVCDSVINMILNQVIVNQEAKEKKFIVV